MPIKEKDTSINNHASVVMEMEYRGAKLLFTGDAWAEDILRVAGGSYAMIKLPHHGSVRNLSERWGEQKADSYFRVKCNNCHNEGARENGMLSVFKINGK